jgi:DNA-binding LacI/PurR family transcriptional regulator
VLPSQRLVNPIFQAILARFSERLDARARIQLHHHDFLKPALYADSGADLVIADGGYGAEALLALQARCPQLVLLNRLHRELPAVCTDNRLGGELMAEHILANGHRRIGILHYGAEGTEEEFVLRLRGIRQQLKAAGVEPVEAALQLHNQRAFTPFQAVELLLRRVPDLTALLCMTDGLALNALEALEETGVAVPGRISLIGFDDLSACRYSVPALTTIRQPVSELGDALAAAVAARLAGGDPPRLRPLKPQLVRRASVADLRTGKQP